MASDAHDALNSLYDVLNVEAVPDVNAEAILTWLQELGCRNEGVCVEPSRCFDGGLGVFATRAFASGDAILRVPLVAVLRRASLPADIGAWLRIAERPQLEGEARLLALLLHQRASIEAGGTAGRFAPYVRALPLELATLLPVGWSDAQLALLEGTPLLAQVVEARTSLRELQRALGCEWEPLLWAHAAYHSRAIALTLDGVAGEGCLVPLLDYCNHRNGSLHAVGVEGDAVVLRAGLAVAAGDEVLLNYGAKGNGELLRCHGFVMPENPADVVPLDLYSLAPSTARLALLARERLPLRHHLFHGGLPAQLLDAVRLLCAPTDEAAAALCDAFEKRAPQFIDWNAIDWAADDDAAAEPEVADPPVQSAADEANARARLAALVRAALDAVRGDEGTSAAGAPGSVEAMCQTYRAGVRSLLREALERI